MQINVAMTPAGSHVSSSSSNNKGFTKQKNIKHNLVVLALFLNKNNDKTLTNYHYE